MAQCQSKRSFIKMAVGPHVVGINKSQTVRFVKVENCHRLKNHKVFLGRVEKCHRMKSRKML